MLNSPDSSIRLCEFKFDVLFRVVSLLRLCFSSSEFLRCDGVVGLVEPFVKELNLRFAERADGGDRLMRSPFGGCGKFAIDTDFCSDFDVDNTPV